MKGSIKFKSEIQNLNKAEIVLKKVSEIAEISDENYGYILLALSEAINNAIVHGNKMNEEKEVKVTYKASKDSIEFIVEDQGQGFDPDSVPDPTSPENIEKATGRGIFIIKNLADKVEFDKGGRVIKMNFNLKK